MSEAQLGSQGAAEQIVAQYTHPFYLGGIFVGQYLHYRNFSILLKLSPSYQPRGRFRESELAVDSTVQV